MLLQDDDVSRFLGGVLNGDKVMSSFLSLVFLPPLLLVSLAHFALSFRWQDIGPQYAGVLLGEDPQKYKIEDVMIKTGSENTTRPSYRHQWQPSVVNLNVCKVTIRDPSVCLMSIVEGRRQDELW